MPGSASTRCTAGPRPTSAPDTTAGHRTVRTGPLTAAEVRTASARFLTAWQQGRVTEAAAATDDPSAAGKLLSPATPRTPA
ncbi:hypothetical protein LT493_28000 [Streptomyces tricolor]|nr:hypothetical protein [Streptomyces tricolor]